MLIGRPTEHGTGIEIFGDFWDLKSLYNSVHALIGKENSPGSGILLEFAYDIRKANANSRETDFFDFDDEFIIYRGVKIFWVNLFVVVKLMRESAGLKKITPDVQADIYRLESIVESCLKSYDATIGKQIFKWLAKSEIARTDYIELLVEHLTYKNLQAQDGKPRFKKLNKQIEALLINNPGHKDFKKFLEAEAKRLKCKIKELDLNMDYEETGFKW